MQIDSYGNHPGSYIFELLKKAKVSWNFQKQKYFLKMNEILYSIVDNRGK